MQQCRCLCRRRSVGRRFRPPWTCRSRRRSPGVLFRQFCGVIKFGRGKVSQKLACCSFCSLLFVRLLCGVIKVSKLCFSLINLLISSKQMFSSPELALFFGFFGVLCFSLTRQNNKICWGPSSSLVLWGDQIWQRQGQPEIGM